MYKSSIPDIIYDIATIHLQANTFSLQYIFTDSTYSATANYSKIDVQLDLISDSNSLKIAKSMTNLSSTHTTSFWTVFANETS